MDPSTYGNDHWLGRHMEISLSYERLLDDPEARDVEQWCATGTISATYLDGDVEQVDVVRARLVRCQLGLPDLWAVLDGLEGDLATVGFVVLDPDTGELADAVTEHAGLGTDLVILNSVVCDERFAGRQIGRWVAGEALEILSRGSALIATMAAPLGSDLEGVARAEASARLAQVWSSIGFDPVRNDVMVRNPDLRIGIDSLTSLRERFGVPAGP